MHILKPLSSKSKLNILFPSEATNMSPPPLPHSGALSPVKKNKAVLFTCLTLKKKKKKIETGSRQNDGTIDKGQIQRFTLPHGPPPLEFPRQRARKQTRAERVERWQGGVLESHLPLFQSLEPRRWIGRHTPALRLLLGRLQELL